MASGPSSSHTTTFVTLVPRSTVRITPEMVPAMPAVPGVPVTGGAPWCTASATRRAMVAGSGSW